MISTARAGALLLTTLALACSKGDSTAPPKPASLEAGTTTTLTGTVAATLAVPPTFIVRSATGAILGNVAVTVAVSGGGGALTGAPTRSQDGPTPVGAWKLGTIAGVNTITVTVAGLPALTLTATGAPDVPNAATVASGNNQIVPAGTTVPGVIAFKLADKFGNGIANATASFQVTAGEGFLSGTASVVTDANGIANAPAWTLGKINVAQQVSATAGNLTAVATAIISSQYRAEVRFFGPTPDPSYAAAFTRAVNKLNAEITGAMTPVPLVNFDVASICATTGVPILNETVQTMIVFVTIRPIDGVGRILAASGPCIIRSGTRFPVIGTMNFDVADVAQLFANGQLNDVALHEMQHVGGYGTLWTCGPGGFPPALASLCINPSTDSTAFIGLNATMACTQLGGSLAACTPGVLLENTGGQGTINSHWRKATFRAELMTGFISSVGTVMPLSVLTIASLADLGYAVNNNVADAYAVASAVGASLRTLRSAQGLAVEDASEELLAPRAEVTREGRVTRLR